VNDSKPSCQDRPNNTNSTLVGAIIRIMVFCGRRVNAADSSAEHAAFLQRPSASWPRNFAELCYPGCAPNRLRRKLISVPVRLSIVSSIPSFPTTLSPTHTPSHCPPGPFCHEPHQLRSLRVLARCGSLLGRGRPLSPPVCRSRPARLCREQVVDQTTACGNRIAQQRG
jgi:hypothetical protein